MVRCYAAATRTIDVHEGPQAFIIGFHVHTGLLERIPWLLGFLSRTPTIFLCAWHQSQY
jgi:hypothetical protein